MQHPSKTPPKRQCFHPENFAKSINSLAMQSFFPIWAFIPSVVDKNMRFWASRRLEWHTSAKHPQMPMISRAKFREVNQPLGTPIVFPHLGLYLPVCCQKHEILRFKEARMIHLCKTLQTPTVPPRKFREIIQPLGTPMFWSACGSLSNQSLVKNCSLEAK